MCNRGFVLLSDAAPCTSALILSFLFRLILKQQKAKRAKEKAQRQEKKQKTEAPPSLAASRLAAYGL